MKVVAVSDTHGMHDRVQVPDGDVLLHAGDLTNHGEFEDVISFSNFLGRLPHRHKIVIAGNHDFCFERDPHAKDLLTNCIYLQDEEIVIDGVKFYGSPWQPWFYDWAFNLQRGPEIRAKWDLIPLDTGVLITHGPPAGHGGMTARGVDAGCEDLLAAVEAIRPRYHVFGHIHEAAGRSCNAHTTFLNASTCTLAYEPTNPALVFEI